MDGTAFEAFIANSSTVFLVILLDFTNTKTTLLIVLPTHPWDLIHGGPCYSATQAILTQRSVSLMQTRI